MRYLWLVIPWLAAATVNAQTNARFTLVCHPDRGGIALDTYLYVDPDNSTVNGNPATITDSEITWRRENAGSEFRYSVDRKTGAMSILGFSVKTGNALSEESGACESATEKK
jgi:hypothetical protein